MNLKVNKIKANSARHQTSHRPTKNKKKTIKWKYNFLKFSKIAIKIAIPERLPQKSRESKSHALNSLPSAALESFTVLSCSLKEGKRS